MILHPWETMAILDIRLSGKSKHRLCSKNPSEAHASCRHCWCKQAVPTDGIHYGHYVYPWDGLWDRDGTVDGSEMECVIRHAMCRVVIFDKWDVILIRSSGAVLLIKIISDWGRNKLSHPFHFRMQLLIHVLASTAIFWAAVIIPDLSPGPYWPW